MNIYQGNLAEQYIGQELYKIFEDNLIYWKRDKKGSSSEIDYLIKDEEIFPIEVKSGKSGSLKSLHLFLKTYEIKNAIIFSTREFSKLELENYNLYFIPLYYVTSIKKWIKNIDKI
jgi:hypothetical protein